MKKQIIFLSSIFLSFSLHALSLVPTQELLAGYLEKDSAIKKSAIALQKKELDVKKTQIENSYTISLSTGDMTITFGNNSEISINPSVKMNLPQYSNLGIELGGKITVKDINSDSKLGGNSSLSFSFDILSSKDEKREITLLQADRSLLEAQRDLSLKLLEKEKSFYEELNKLLNQVKSIITRQKSYYDDKITFEKVKAQGYAKNSSTYRKAEMQVVNDEHEIESAERNLLNSYRLFYVKCGKELEISNISDFLSLVPEDITETSALNIQDFSLESFKEYEKSVWNNKIKTLERNSEKNYSLAAETGYTYDFDKNNQRVNMGVKGSYNGIDMKLSAGIPFTGENKNPSLTLGASFNPSTLKTDELNHQKDKLTQQEEIIDIETSIANYNNTVIAKKLELENILWEKSSTKENLQMYSTTESEMKKWFNQGIITQSEYLSAKVNRQSAWVSSVINSIDLIIYNAEIKTLFNDDAQVSTKVK